MKIIDPGFKPECPQCHSKDVRAYYDMTPGDIGLWLITIFCLVIEHRHYHCNSCACTWRD